MGLTGKITTTTMWAGLKWLLTQGKKSLAETDDSVKQVQLIALDNTKHFHETTKQMEAFAEAALLQHNDWKKEFNETMFRLEGKLDDALCPDVKELDDLQDKALAPRPRLKRIKFIVNNRIAFVYGGPYRDKPANIDGVKMAEEIDLPCTLDIPTRDFDVPAMDVMELGLRDAFILLFTKGEIYAGCMGGIGRTGLFLALMIKTYKCYQMGEAFQSNWEQNEMVDSVIHELRAEVHPHAVETGQQRVYIDEFDVSEVVQYLSDMGIFS